MTEFTTPIQRIELGDLPPGMILDIGGGGEGIIARIGKSRVTAIDKLQEEIEEARDKSPEAKWMTADASNLPFSPGVFDHATAFFSLMYMRDGETKDLVFKEIHRVLPPGGEFWIWDTDVDVKEEIFILMLEISLPDSQKIETGYGVLSDPVQTEGQTLVLLEKAGFAIETRIRQDLWYFIKAKRI